MPCPQCGVSVDGTEVAEHACERERWLDYQMFARRQEFEAVADAVAAYLSSREGRFELWYPERERRGLGEAA